MTTFIEFLFKEVMNVETIFIHSKILKDDSLVHFERTLQTAQPINLANFYRDSAAFLNDEGLDEIETEITQNARTSLSEDDKKIIKFLSDINNQSLSRMLDLSGTIIQVAEIVDEIKKREGQIPDNLRVNLLLWCYLNMYETVLALITRDIQKYIETKKTKEDREILNEIRNKTESGDHLTAGKINELLIKLEVLQNENSSLVGKEGRFFRNRLGHANVFFDSGSKCIVGNRGARYSIEEFKQEYRVLYEFLLEWIYQLNKESPNIKQTIELTFEKLEKAFRRIERGGDCKRVFKGIILEWRTIHEKRYGRGKKN